MPYVLLVLVSLMWSFVGVLVKLASLSVDNSTITLCRFLFGVIFLGFLLKTRRQSIHLCLKNKWIWIAALGKCVNYIFENLAISIGFAYGNIVVPPVQAVTLAVISAHYFNEKMTKRKITSLILCVFGVLLVGWKGVPLSEIVSSNITTILFVVSAIGASIHIVGQKKLITSMDSANMNFSIFLICTIITAIPVPYTLPSVANFSPSVIFSLVALGFITGISFYLNAIVLKKISLLISALISNCSVLFTLFWAWLFFHEPVNEIVIAGVFTFLLGILMLHIPNKM
jgi:drug/metabolite transporter (DMT)-like permease